MPWINLTMRKGAFTKEVQHAVLAKLTDALMFWGKIPDTPKVRSVQPLRSGVVLSWSRLARQPQCVSNRLKHRPLVVCSQNEIPLQDRPSLHTVPSYAASPLFARIMALSTGDLRNATRARKTCAFTAVTESPKSRAVSLRDSSRNGPI